MGKNNNNIKITTADVKDFDKIIHDLFLNENNSSEESDDFVTNTFLDLWDKIANCYNNSEETEKDIPDNSEKTEKDIPDNSEETTKDIPDNSEETEKNIPDNSEETTESKADNKSGNKIKQRLLKEAEKLYQEEKIKEQEKYNRELNEIICEKIHKILEDYKKHEYKIYKRTEKNPAAVEISLKNMPIYLKDNTYILKEVETLIKNYYDFTNVFINIETLKNKEFINLKVYMIL